VISRLTLHLETVYRSEYYFASDLSFAYMSTVSTVPLIGLNHHLHLCLLILALDFNSQSQKEGREFLTLS